jgi:3'-phosphoadenosine 5'-phosphosulfate synthase
MTSNAGDHGHAAPDMEDCNILSFTKVFYDVQDHKKKPMDSRRKQGFLSISGSRTQMMAYEVLQKCEGDKIPAAWEDKPTCVPHGIMVKSGWEIMIDYYQNINSPRWIPFATQFSKPVVDTTRSFSSEGTFGRTDYKLHFKNGKCEKISPWHNVGWTARPGWWCTCSASWRSELLRLSQVFRVTVSQRFLAA